MQEPGPADSVDSGSNLKNAFFYGTLMHPRILKQIILNDASHLRCCPAVLVDYTRHRVKGETYPGIIPLSQARELLNRELQPDETVVRGTLVEGLTEGDLRFLDDFEDIDATEEYIRVSVSVHPLAPFHPMETHSENEDDVILLHATPLPDLARLAPAVEVDTYVYRNLSALEEELWSFDDFVRKHASKWFNYVADNPSFAAPG